MRQTAGENHTGRGGALRNETSREQPKRVAVAVSGRRRAFPSRGRKHTERPTVPVAFSPSSHLPPSLAHKLKKNSPLSRTTPTDPRPRGARRHARGLPGPPRRAHGQVRRLQALQGLCAQVSAGRRPVPARRLHRRHRGRVEGDACDDDGDEGG